MSATRRPRRVDLPSSPQRDAPAAGPRLVVSAETAGLGNRIKSWVSAMRLGPEVAVHWVVNANMPAAFGDLFEGPGAVESVPAGAVVYASWRLAILPEDLAHLPHGFSTAGAGAHALVRGVGKAWWTLRGRPNDRYRYMLFPKSHSRRSARADARHIDLEYGRIPDYFRQIYAPLFARIPVRLEIAAAVDSWAAAHLDDEVVGVQVRTWRDDPHRHRKYHAPAMRRLLRLIDETDSAARFFVVSDSDDVPPWLHERYGERILTFPRRIARQESWRSPEGIVEDLVDMLLLARTRRMLASYLSTFSEAAWWLGGARADVAVF